MGGKYAVGTMHSTSKGLIKIVDIFTQNEIEYVKYELNGEIFSNKKVNLASNILKYKERSENSRRRHGFQFETLDIYLSIKDIKNKHSFSSVEISNIIRSLNLTVYRYNFIKLKDYTKIKEFITLVSNEESIN